MSSSDDKILIKTCGKLKDFLPEASSRNSLTNIEKTYNGRLSAKSCGNLSFVPPLYQSAHEI